MMFLIKTFTGKYHTHRGTADLSGSFCKDESLTTGRELHSAQQNVVTQPPVECLSIYFTNVSQVIHAESY